MKETEQYIKTHFDIHQVNELSKVAALFKLTILKKGEYFLHTGKVCNQICFIQSGLLRVFAMADGKEITQWIAGKGHFGTDLSSFFFQKPSRWTIQALADTEIYSVTKEDYLTIGNLVPKWHELEKNFIIKCAAYMEDRIFSHLSMSAEERYLLFFDTHKELFNQVPLQFIASLLGMTPETFSRIRKKQSL